MARLLPSLFALIASSIAAVMVVAALRAPPTLHRYLRSWAWTVAAIWAAVGGYLLLAQPSYTSKWTLILPTSTSSVSLQLESIGHAQTIPSSPFGSSSLSPKVIYKEIMASEQVRTAAAHSLGLKLTEFGAARVKLIDETALMLLEITGRTPDQAQSKARALLESFHVQLDVLRQDEIRRRAEVVEHSLKTYQANLLAARNRILDHQQATGVLSINQFNESSTGLQLLQRKLTDTRAEIGRLETEQRLLSDELGIDVSTAAALLRLSADPSFVRLASDHAENRALLIREGERMGPANPLLTAQRQRTAAIADDLRRLIERAGGGSGTVDKALLVLNGTHRSELVKTLLSTAATIAGRRQELDALQEEGRRLSEEVARMSTAVARLEDLKKDHLVAEAVFTSALARLDTNKVDIYASYPMVQTLEAPDLPKKRSSPHVMVAILGGVLASLLALGAWGMAWLRHMFSQRR